MQTLIELYDERPLENVLGVEVFHPARVVYLCPEKHAKREDLRQQMQAYFTHRGIQVELEFIGVSVFDATAALQTLRAVVARCPDCALDITGGTDAVLYAAGMLGAELPIPAFTYSHKKSCFFDIRNAAFAAGLPCRVHFSVEDCILMAGGAMREGRMDNAILQRYLTDIDPFFQLYLRHRRSWIRLISYIQRISHAEPDKPIPLHVSGPWVVKGDRGTLIEAPEDGLQELEALGLIQDLRMDRQAGVSFAFRDHQVRFWLRDIGSVLELYVYKAFVDAGLFDDIRLSVQIDWEANEQQHAVTNELDVMATRGVTPVFISCKSGEVRTEALNELAILRDRFGGKVAKAAVVTAERSGRSLRSRATELGIQLIDREDLFSGSIGKQIRHLMDK